MLLPAGSETSCGLSIPVWVPEIYVACIYTAHDVISLVYLHKMLTMLCILAGFQFDVDNIDDNTRVSLTNIGIYSSIFKSM